MNGEKEMRICFVTNGNLSDFRGGEREADLLLFPFHALGEVSYERELKGETSLFEDVAILSKTAQCVVVSGCCTNARGIRRKSAVVAERGRILGVSDMINRIDGSEYRSGAGVKLYDTKAGKLGVVVAEDLYFPHVLETLSVCGADIALCIFEELNEGLELNLTRAGAFFFGIPVCLCAYGYAEVADPSGKLRFSSPKSPCTFDMQSEREYHIVETRKRGFFLKRKTEY